jgi:hypothetical protein
MKGELSEELFLNSRNLLILGWTVPALKKFSDVNEWRE